MSIKVYLANTYNMASTCIFRDMQAVKTERCILLAPDNSSFSLENKILTKLNIESSFDIEVTSFSRLAMRSLRGKIKRTLSPEGTVMLLRRAILDVKDELCLFQNADIVDFPREMYAVITSLRNSGINYEDILSKFKCGERLYDIGLIYKRYVEILRKDFSDGSTRLEDFAEIIDKIPNIENTNFFITYFDDFTSPQYDIISRLAMFSKGVTIGLVAPNAECGNARIYNTRPIEKFRKIARDNNIEYAEESIEEASIVPYKKQILYSLFSYKKRPVVHSDNHVKIYSAKNVFDELEFVASTIKRRVFEGARYKDFSVVLCNADAYKNVISSVFKNYEIPYFLDKKIVFSKTPIAKFLMSAINVWRENFSIKSVLELVKNPLFINKTTRRDVEIFENFVRENSINNLNKQLTDEVSENIRKLVLDTIKAFSKDLSSVPEFLEAINNFIADNNIYEICEEKAESGDENDVAESQFVDKLKCVLDEMSKTLGDTKIDINEFYEILDSVFQNIKIALVPQFLDSVFVGGMDDFYDDVDTIFFVGAVEGYFPKTVHDTEVLGREEEGVLEKSGLNLYPTKLESMRKNCFALTRLLITPQNKLYITYPEILDGRKTKRSSTLDELSRYLDDGTKKLDDDEERLKTIKINNKLTTINDDYRFLLATRKNSLNMIAKGIKRGENNIMNSVYELLDDSDKTRIEKFTTQDTPEKEKVAGNISLNRGTFSASQLENYFECPYQHFFRYGLRLKPLEKGKMRTLETGTLMHAIMEKLVKDKAYLTPTDEVLSDVVNSAVDEQLKTDAFKNFNSSRHEAIIRRVKKDGLEICKNISLEIANSAFKPYIAEGKIGDLNKSDFAGIKVKLGDNEYQLVGSIDRIDEKDGHFTIIDYKSFKKDISIKDVYTGAKIQPVLYMRAVTSDDNLKYPAGILYQPISVGFKGEDNERFRMRGFVINDPDVVRLLDESIDNGVSNFFPVSIKNDGTITKKQTVISDTSFTSLGIYAEKLTNTAIEEIEEGFINPSPKDNACDFCDVKDICPFENDIRVKRKKFPKISVDDLLKLANGEALNVLGGDDDE